MAKNIFRRQPSGRLQSDALYKTRRGNQSQLIASGFFEASAGGAVAHSYIGSGGLLLSGLAPTSKGKSIVASGGVLFSGTALKAKGKATVSSGGLLLAGSSPATKGKAWAASGGGVFGGAASTSYTASAVTQTFTYAGSGGMALSGLAPVTKGKVWTATGGLALGGGASLAKSKAVSGAGGVLVTGAADAVKGKTFIASGGLNASGAAVASYTAASGVQTFVYIGNGGIAVAGQCISQRVAANEVAVGGGVFTPKRSPVVAPRIFGYVATGGVHTGGGAVLAFAPVPVRIYDFKPQGGASLSGAARIEHHDQIAAVIATDDEWMLLAA